MIDYETFSLDEYESLTLDHFATMTLDPTGLPDTFIVDRVNIFDPVVRFFAFVPKTKTNIFDPSHTNP